MYCLLDAFQVLWLVPLVKSSSFSGFLANIWGWCPDIELLEPELWPAIWVSFDIAPPYPLPLTKYLSLVLVLPWGYWNCSTCAASLAFTLEIYRRTSVRGQQLTTISRCQSQHSNTAFLKLFFFLTTSGPGSILVKAVKNRGNFSVSSPAMFNTSGHCPVLMI